MVEGAEPMQGQGDSGPVSGTMGTMVSRCMKCLFIFDWRPLTAPLPMIPFSTQHDGEKKKGERAGGGARRGGGSWCRSRRAKVLSPEWRSTLYFLSAPANTVAPFPLSCTGLREAGVEGSLEPAEG